MATRFSEIIHLPGGDTCSPKGLAIQQDCSVLVTDPGSHCIWKIDADLESENSSPVSVFAGRPGMCGHADGQAKEALFDFPEGIAISSDGIAYVGDTSRRIGDDGHVMKLRAISDNGLLVETCYGSYDVHTHGCSNCLDFGPDSFLYWANGKVIKRMERQGKLQFGLLQVFACPCDEISQHVPSPLGYTFSCIDQIKWTCSGTLYITDSRQRDVLKVEGCITPFLGPGDLGPGGCPGGIAGGLDDYIYLSNQKGASGQIDQAISQHNNRSFVQEHMVNDKTQKIRKPGWMALDPIRNWLFFVDNDSVGLVLLFYHSTCAMPQTPPSTLQEDLSKLIDDPSLSDVLFTVEGKQLRGCRAVLAARSAYFKGMFQSQMLEATQSAVTIADVKYEAFRTVLVYLHTGKTDVVTDPEIIREMYTLADRYQLDHLMAIAREKLVYNFTVENVVSLYRLAFHLGDTSLSNACIEMISRNLEIIEETDDFKQLEKDVKLQMYSSVVKCVKKRH